MPDAATRAGAAAELFGRKAGPGLLDLLKEGSGGLAKMQADAERLGLTFSSIEGKKVEEANDALTRTMESIQGLARELTITLGPAVKTIADSITNGIEADRRFIMGTEKGPRQAMADKYIASLSDKHFNEGNRAGFFTKGADGNGVDEFLMKAAADRAQKMLDQSAANKLKSGQLVAEAPARALDAAFSKFTQLAGDGADALGKLESKLRDTEKSTFWAATKQMFGMGPFNPNATKGKLPEIASGFDASQVGELFGGRGMTDVRGNAALERGTAAAFSQERRSGQQSQLVEESKKHTQYLKQTVKALEDLKGQNLGAQLLPANLV
jgi:hypothetical protein